MLLLRFAAGAGASLWGEQWYPVGVVATQPTSPTSQFLLGAPIVVFHDGTKWCTALDRCPHRFARFSEGCVVAGAIECPYHGWRFDGTDGSLVALPQADDDDDDQGVQMASSRCSALTLPTTISHGLIFAMAAPLFGIVPSPCSEPALETALDLDDVFAADGDFSWTDYSRDLPMDATTLLENVLDPSHLPFTHDGTISRRTAAGPVSFGPVERFSGDGFRVRRGDRGSSVNFFAPNLVVSETRRPNSFRDLNVVYAVPQLPGRCRLYVRVVFETKKLPNALARLAIRTIFSGPPWISHLTNHKVLEDDNIFLHFAEEELRDDHPTLSAPDWSSRLFMPTSADKTTIAFRKWIDRYTNGTGVTFVERASSARLAVTTATRKSLTDRLATHTDICTSCTRARNVAKRLASSAFVASHLSLAAAAAARVTHRKWLALLSCSLFLFAHFLTEKFLPEFENGSYPPRRNTLARLKPWRRKVINRDLGRGN